MWFPVYGLQTAHRDAASQGFDGRATVYFEFGKSVILVVDNQKQRTDLITSGSSSVSIDIPE